jgi:hypothetical protein
MEQAAGEGVGRHTDVGVEEMRRKPSSSWISMSHSGRCSGAHSTMYCVCPYSNLHTEYTIGTPSVQSVHDYCPFALEAVPDLFQTLTELISTPSLEL